MKRFVTLAASLFIFAAGFLVEGIDFGKPQPLVLTQAEAYYGTVRRPVRRTARRTARRTSRRVSYRHNYYRPPAVVYGAGAAAATATAIAIGSRVATLPPACSNVSVNGRVYYNCGGTYYQPVYDGPDVVYVVVQSPQ
jgi:hypothetical protein